MKLIYCPACYDLVRLIGDNRVCDCGKSWGRYTGDGLHAQYGGTAVPAFIDNQSFQYAKMRKDKDSAQSWTFIGGFCRENEPHFIEEPRFSDLRM